MDVKYKRPELGEVVSVAKRMGHKVWTFKPYADGPISQIFIDNGITFGTGYVEYFGEVSFATCHKACREHGTAFSIQRYTSINDGIRGCLQYAPWCAAHHDVVKQTFAEYSSAYPLNHFYEL